ncbi:hypothetical protein Mlg_2297 [Alkalilimnicola ehrlichii MLHE-1]|uniref:Uncharacterized protein n=1 Tax=Alkalilimnicola ehrlichii (strain ATCC BAA-1101 / DSM 17681 / MLHE-1) TaxID=187272 RepID=Q0A698_ALKEH|nr:hypothetical protein Mlg_2297 [Alkalilimnicola ehrlichii MLHE-1]
MTACGSPRRCAPRDDGGVGAPHRHCERGSAPTVTARSEATWQSTPLDRHGPPTLAMTGGVTPPSLRGGEADVAVYPSGSPRASGPRDDGGCCPHRHCEEAKPTWQSTPLDRRGPPALAMTGGCCPHRHCEEAKPTWQSTPLDRHGPPALAMTGGVAPTVTARRRSRRGSLPLWIAAGLRPSR